MEKKTQFNTDFLFTSPNFLTGAATIFNLAGNFYEHNSSKSEDEADCSAIANDFKIVGNDLEKTLSKYDLLNK
jgi:hypothetical protein